MSQRLELQPDNVIAQGLLGLASPSSLPPASGKQGLFVSGDRIPAIVTAYLGRTEEIHFVRNAGADSRGKIKVNHACALELWDADTGRTWSLPTSTEGGATVAKLSIPAAD